MCPQEQLLAVAFSNNAVATTTLQNILESDEIEGASKTIEGDVMDFLYGGFHHG